MTRAGKRLALTAILLTAGSAAFLHRSGAAFRHSGAAIAECEEDLGRRLAERGILAYWDFDEAAVVDRVAHAVGVTDGTRVCRGRFGRARQMLPEERGYVETQFPQSSLGSNYTVACWLKLRGTNRNQQIFEDLSLRDGMLHFRVPNSGTQLVCRVQTTGRFLHLAAAVDCTGGAARLYVDGRLEASCVTGRKPPLHGSSGMVLGRDLRKPPSDFAIDDLTVWGRALREEEIQAVWRSGIPVGRLAAPRSARRLRRMRQIRGASLGLAKTADLFNPRVQMGPGTPEDLPLFNLVMSRNDLRTLNRFHNRRIDNGLNSWRLSEGRAIQVFADGRFDAAHVEIAGSPLDGRVRMRRPTYFVTAVGTNSTLPWRRLVLEPPEGLGFVSAVLAGELSASCGRPCVPTRLCLLSINGVPQGVYLYRVMRTERELTLCGTIPNGDGFTLAGLPFSRARLLRSFDALAGTMLPELQRDRKMPLSSVALRRAVREERASLPAGAAGESDSDAGAVAGVKAYLDEDILLAGNPSADYVLENLDFGVREINGVTVSFHSDRPGIIGDDGSVTRPEGNMVTNRVTARFARGGFSAERQLSFRVMPRELGLPVLVVNTCSKRIDERHRSFAMIELIDDNGRSRSGVIQCSIRLRGNTTLYREKKQYSVDIMEPRTILGFGGSGTALLHSFSQDSTYLRDKLTYDVYRCFAGKGQLRYCPEIRYVELVLDNRYDGIYGISDEVCAETLGFSACPAARRARPCVIYKAVEREANFQSVVREAYLQKEPPIALGEYWGPYEELIGFLGGSGSREFKAGAGSVIDIDSVIDFFIMANLAHNQEGIRGNLFLVRGPRAADRFLILPWDYDKAYEGDTWLSNHLCRRLEEEIPGYRARVQDRWDTLRAGPLSEAALMARLDSQEACLAACLPRDSERWPALAERRAERTARLRLWLRERLAAMDRMIAVKYADHAPGGVSAGPGGNQNVATNFFLNDSATSPSKQ